MQVHETRQSLPETGSPRWSSGDSGGGGGSEGRFGQAELQARQGGQDSLHRQEVQSLIRD